MNKSTFTILTGLTLALGSASALADDAFYSAKVGADMWWGNTEANEVTRDDSTSASLYFAFEHKLPMIPNASIRYTTIDADYVAFDKYDYTLYYSLMEHDLLHFDAGMTFTQYSNSHYVNGAPAANTEKFDEFTWNWYAQGEINVPKTELSIIGQMEFGDSSGIKSADIMAGVQYRIPLEAANIALRGGYRVIDLESDAFASDLGKSFILVDGWFLGGAVEF